MSKTLPMRENFFIHYIILRIILRRIVKFESLEESRNKDIYFMKTRKFYR